MIFLLFLTFLLQQTSSETTECPIEKTVGDTCYTLVEYTDTAQEYGCFEGCAYKKSEDEEGGPLYCFKRGSLPVSDSECAAPDSPDFSEEFEAIDSIEKPVIFHNTFNSSARNPPSVVVNSFCFPQRNKIQPNGEWKSPCHVRKITGYYKYIVDGTTNQNRINCTKYSGTNTFHSNFDISPDSLEAGGCQITLPIGVSNTNMTTDISSETPRAQGLATIKNEFMYPINVRVVYYPVKKVRIQPGQSRVREVLIKAIFAHYTFNGIKTKCEHYKSPFTPPQFQPTFVIYSTGGPTCGVGLPTSPDGP